MQSPKCFDKQPNSVQMKARPLCSRLSHLQVSRLPYRRRQWHPTPVLLPGKSHSTGILLSNLNGKKSGKRVDICITESLCCTPETNPTYSNIKFKNKLTIWYYLICFLKNNFKSIECKLGWREAREVEEPVGGWLWSSRQTTTVAVAKVRRNDREKLGP